VAAHVTVVHDGTALMHLTGWTRWIALLVAVLVLWGGVYAPASAKNLALLIGVTQYDETAIRTLEGPNNDVILIWRELQRRGFKSADMAVLADNLPVRNDVPKAAAQPTRAAILDALKTLADRAQAGDFVVFQFSGHGSTQPVTDPQAQIEPEPDGRDQVLLPRDAGLYDATLKSIRNGIIDDELARALDAIRLKGATVWAVIDACHSGTVTRSAGDSVARAVPASALGVPAAAGPTGATVTPARRAGTFVAHNSADKAPLIGFYAVDSRSLAIERPFPGYAPGLAGKPKAERIGVFTAHLVRALTSGKAVTFRDLARTISSDMAKLSGSASAPLPVFDGALDRPIGGGEAVPAVRHAGNFDDRGISISAGTLLGFENGAGIAVYDGPLRDAKRLAKARVTESTAATSLAAVEPGGADIRFGTDVWVEVEEPAVSFTFRVALPESADARIKQLVTRAKEGNGRRVLAIDLVAAGEAADVNLTVDQGRLWIVPEGQQLIADAARPGTSISLELSMSDGSFAGALRRILWSMARAANLVRLASAGGDDAAQRVEAVVEISRESDPAQIANPKRECGDLAKPQATEQLTPTVATVASHCDMFSVSLKNAGGREADVAVFYLDSRAGVALVDDRMANNGCVVTLPAAMTEPMRLPPRQFAIWEDGKPLALGMQRILVFAMPRAGTSPPSLCHLREASIEAATQRSRSAAGAKGLAGMLSQAGLADGSMRSAAPTAASEESGGGVMVRQFTFDLREAGRP
jgi:hypothetical protein